MPCSRVSLPTRRRTRSSAVRARTRASASRARPQVVKSALHAARVSRARRRVRSASCSSFFRHSHTDGRPCGGPSSRQLSGRKSPNTGWRATSALSGKCRPDAPEHVEEDGCGRTPTRARVEAFVIAQLCGERHAGQPARREPNGVYSRECTTFFGPTKRSVSWDKGTRRSAVKISHGQLTRPQAPAARPGVPRSSPPSRRRWRGAASFAGPPAPTS